MVRKTDLLLTRTTILVAYLILFSSREEIVGLEFLGRAVFLSLGPRLQVEMTLS